MLPTLIIVFREVFEAGLIIGIVMAVTSGVAGRGLWVVGGVAAGVLGACIVALFAGGLSQLFHGSGQELFNASILGFAVLMLGWHNVWMARHGRELAAEMRAAGQAVVEGSKSLAALAVVVAIAVLREGSEVVLFLYGVAAAEGGASGSMLVGGRYRSGSRRAGLFVDLSWPSDDSDPLSVRRHQYADRAAGGRHGGTGHRLPRAGRHPHGARPDGVGYIVDLARWEVPRTRAAHADRLRGSAHRHAAHCLCSDACPSLRC